MGRRPSWVRRQLRSEHGATAFSKASVGAAIVLGVVYLPLIVALHLHDPDVISTATLRAERVSIEVVDARSAAFQVDGVKATPLGTAPAADAACRKGLVRPSRGTVVTFGRVGRGALEITLVPRTAETMAAVFEPAGGGPAEPLRGAAYLQTMKECDPSASMRLPIWGYMRAGLEPRPETGREQPQPTLLLDGKLQVSAHSLFSDSLYEVTSLTIPVGSRLETYVPAAEPASESARLTQEAAAPAIWWGAVLLDPDHIGLDVLAATEAPNVALYRPYKQAADVVRVSELAQITGDPNIVQLHVVLGVLLFLVGMCSSIATATHEHGKESEKRP